MWIYLFGFQLFPFYSVIMREMTSELNIRMTSGGIVECILLLVWINLLKPLAPWSMVCTYSKHNKYTLSLRAQPEFPLISSIYLDPWTPIMQSLIV
jgi:hypothetical protein